MYETNTPYEKRRSIIWLFGTIKDSFELVMPRHLKKPFEGKKPE